MNKSCHKQVPQVFQIALQMSLFLFVFLLSYDLSLETVLHSYMCFMRILRRQSNLHSVCVCGEHQTTKQLLPDWPMCICRSWTSSTCCWVRSTLFFEVLAPFSHSLSVARCFEIDLGRVLLCSRSADKNLHVLNPLVLGSWPVIAMWRHGKMKLKMAYSTAILISSVWDVLKTSPVIVHSVSQHVLLASAASACCTLDTREAVALPGSLSSVPCRLVSLVPAMMIFNRCDYSIGFRRAVWTCAIFQLSRSQVLVGSLFGRGRLHTLLHTKTGIVASPPKLHIKMVAEW